METRAVLRGVRLSAQKGRLVVDLVRGKSVGQALNILAYSPKKGALIVKTIYVEKGIVLKRFTARAKGRGNRITKPTCHVFVTVGN